MFYPEGEGLSVERAGEFFLSFLKPQMPDVWGQPNHGNPSPLGEVFSAEAIDRVRSNIERMILNSL